MAHRHTVQTKAHGGSVKRRVAHDDEIGKEAGIKRGGRAKKDGGSVAGFKSGGRLDKRARGGGVGADKHPLSSASIGHKRGGSVGK